MASPAIILKGKLLKRVFKKLLLNRVIGHVCEPLLVAMVDGVAVSLKHLVHHGHSAADPGGQHFIHLLPIEVTCAEICSKQRCRQRKFDEKLVAIPKYVKKDPFLSTKAARSLASDFGDVLIDVSRLEPGLFILQVSNGSAVINRRFVKQ